MHHTYDKNLTHTDDRDLVHHLQQKQMRTERYACRVRADSLSMSPGNSVHGSMEHVYGKSVYFALGEGMLRSTIC